jgi:hypothetical protein
MSDVTAFRGFQVPLPNPEKIRNTGMEWDEIVITIHLRERYRT